MLKLLLPLLLIANLATGQFRSYHMSELYLRGQRVANLNTTTLSDSDSSVPISQVVFNAIQAAVIGSGGDKTEWTSLITYGGQANGSFTTGTDNTPYMNAALAAAPNNGVLYIPPGSYKFNETIRWPTNKNVFLISYGNLYFGDDTAFIIDGSSRALVFYGAIYGRNQLGTINYSGQTNPGIYMRNLYNSSVAVNVVSGFKYAFKVGGFAGGNQYNKISYNLLQRNSVGIQICAEGPTTNGPRWSNENTYVGGQIGCDTGIVYLKDAIPGDRYNGNKFYNTGFEFSGNNIPMKVAILGDWSTNNVFYGGRIEPIGVDKEFLCTGDVNAMQFYGWYMQDAWLNNMGYGAVVVGAIYSNSGILIGNEAYGYQYSPNGTYQNGRMRVKGLRWSLTVSNELASNIDVEWVLDTDILTTSASYTVQQGIDFVKVQYAGGTNTTTLPNAQIRANRAVTIKNLHATNSVTVAGATSGSIITIPGGGGCITYYSDGNVWYDIANNFNTGGGGGGSSQWIDDPNGIRYAGKVAVARTAPTAAMHIGYRNTPGTANSGGLKVDGGVVMTAPENGLIENDLTDFWVTTQNTRKKIVTDANINTINFSGGLIAVVNDANYTVATGVNTVLYSASTGTKVLTLPDPTANANRAIWIRNSGSSAISLPTGYYATSGVATTTLANGSGVYIKSDGTRWWLILN